MFITEQNIKMLLDHFKIDTSGNIVEMAKRFNAQVETIFNIQKEKVNYSKYNHDRYEKILFANKHVFQDDTHKCPCCGEEHPLKYFRGLDNTKKVNCLICRRKGY